jgi:hypothetical protein
MKTQLQQELKNIEAGIAEYMEGPILPDKEDLEANKAVKIKLKAFIEKVVEQHAPRKISDQEKSELIKKAVITLAANTGHHEDQAIADEILDELYAKEYLSVEDIRTFEEHKGTRRWD